MDAEAPSEREVLEERYDLTHKVIWISSLYKCFAPTFAKLADGSTDNFPGVLKDQALKFICARWLLLEKATLRAMRQDELLEFPLNEAIGSSLQHADRVLNFLDEAVDKPLLQELARCSGGSISITWVSVTHHAAEIKGSTVVGCGLSRSMRFSGFAPTTYILARPTKVDCRSRTIQKCTLSVGRCQMHQTTTESRIEEQSPGIFPSA